EGGCPVWGVLHRRPPGGRCARLRQNVGVRIKVLPEGSPTMRLGLFGGTFDPIHLGHLVLAEQCREECGLDRLWFVVAGEPPHKPGGRTAVTHRLEMARIPVAVPPTFSPSP